MYSFDVEHLKPQDFEAYVITILYPLQSLKRSGLFKHLMAHGAMKRNRLPQKLFVHLP